VQKIRLKRAVIFTALFLFGCSSDQVRITKAFGLAENNQYRPLVVKTSTFPLQIFYKDYHSKHAVIYFEGDGLVINKYGEVAINPTPTDPMAIRLASVDSRNLTKVVITRPYHYTKDHIPDPKYWTTARYSTEVIQATIEAIQFCQQKFHFETVEFVAYSGGASVALLVAAKFKNLQRIITFAGNLDHSQWTHYHQTQPLSLSLNPLENREKLREIPQIHFLGTEDANTTIDLGLQYKQKLGSEKICIIPIKGFEHDSNWPDIWKEQIVKLK
jgi:hypothetical protein